MAFRLFVPILAGATLRERLFACLGAVVGIALTGAVCSLIMKGSYHTPLIVAPMGASAVLLFAVPASPLAQPWPIIGGNTISAFVGVVVAYFVRDPVLASGLAVGIAIGAMSFTRSLHPPGGAAALTAALATPAVIDAGFLFPFIPVAINSVLLVGVGLIFHKLGKRSYPHVARTVTGTHGTVDRPAQLRVGFQPEDIDAALAAIDETFDIDRKDLDRLVRQVELQALVRSSAVLLCEDIVSRDVIQIEENARVVDARDLLIEHNIRTLPVVTGEGKLRGIVGLRELADAGGTVGAHMSPAATASLSLPALALLPKLTDGRTHAVVVVDDDTRVLGIITQTDLLAATARLQLGEAVAA